MDAFELLLRASDHELNPELDIKDLNTVEKVKFPFDYREHMKNTMLGKSDAEINLKSNF